ncbi:type II toxin-antitoxin system VapC family toxin [Synechocystis sp. LEGE 06083]|uniref:type II toxin-antitoxin system VapC family toxin n=1 Tax=Synechocystis sp. LEGE 06083 TaxID=915336 RepID=UPI001881A031|nr:type II toxin-antitoxin system VapC family toxin [Synechocystis sp. LEGE 06083]MBE9194443.1 type II toxin-antitoxin system VapC family toxin [Synechocystis sp. LEGE 06083]
MVIDTSALVCIFLAEPEAEFYARLLADLSEKVISAANWFETMMVVSSRLGEIGVQEIEQLLELTSIKIIAVDGKMAQIAFDAWLTYGKGRHPAGLNFGNCFAYALAKSRDEALLFKGDDFSKTDLTSAIE